MSSLMRIHKQLQQQIKMMTKEQIVPHLSLLSFIFHFSTLFPTYNMPRHVAFDDGQTDKRTHMQSTPNKSVNSSIFWQQQTAGRNFLQTTQAADDFRMEITSYYLRSKPV